jgi:hypothetical protein
MLTFRCYLLFAFALVIVKVVEVAIGRWVLTPVNRPSEPRPPVPVLCAGRSGARGRMARTNSGALSAVHTSHLHLHKYFCQIVDNIDCHNKQEE